MEQVKAPRGIGARLALLAAGVYGEPVGGSTAAGLAWGMQGRHRKEGAVTWIKPAFDEIKMDAEAKSYSDGLTW